MRFKISLALLLYCLSKSQECTTSQWGVGQRWVWKWGWSRSWCRIMKWLRLLTWWTNLQVPSRSRSIRSLRMSPSPQLSSTSHSTTNPPPKPTNTHPPPTPPPSLSPSQTSSTQSNSPPNLSLFSSMTYPTQSSHSVFLPHSILLLSAPFPAKTAKALQTLLSALTAIKYPPILYFYHYQDDLFQRKFSPSWHLHWPLPIRRIPWFYPQKMPPLRSQLLLMPHKRCRTDRRPSQVPHLPTLNLPAFRQPLLQPMS